MTNHWHDDEYAWFCPCDETAPRLSPTEAAIVARFDAAEPAPESYVRQHRSEPSCWCSPRQVGTLGVWTHNMGEGEGE